MNAIRAPAKSVAGIRVDGYCLLGGRAVATTTASICRFGGSLAVLSPPWSVLVVWMILESKK